jgi:hypothetical protein
MCRIRQGRRRLRQEDRSQRKIRYGMSYHRHRVPIAGTRSYVRWTLALIPSMSSTCWGFPSSFFSTLITFRVAPYTIFCHCHSPERAPRPRVRPTGRGCEFGCELHSHYASHPSFAPNEPLFSAGQPASPHSRADSKSVQCAFESHRGHTNRQVRAAWRWCEDRVDWRLPRLTHPFGI